MPICLIVNQDFKKSIEIYKIYKFNIFLKILKTDHHISPPGSRKEWKFTVLSTSS